MRGNGNPVEPRITRTFCFSQRKNRSRTRTAVWPVTVRMLALRFFDGIRLWCLHRSQFRLGLRDGLDLRFELERQLVDLAGEPERRVVAILQHRDPGAGVHADVEGLVLRERDRRTVFDGFPVHFLAIHREYACAALAQSGPIGLEVEDDSVLARA